MNASRLQLPKISHRMQNATQFAAQIRDKVLKALDVVQVWTTSPKSGEVSPRGRCEEERSKIPAKIPKKPTFKTRHLGILGNAVWP